MHVSGTNDAIVLSKQTTMKTLKNKTVGIIATLMLLLPVFTFVDAQTIGEVVNETSNSMLLRLESKEKLNAPSKIMLVYDSNMITLESTSGVIRRYSSSSSSSKNYENSYNSYSALEMALVVDLEDDIELEEWMLEPFELQAEATSYLKLEEDEEIVLEPWMTDLSHWK
jgi:hypothetical protein